MILPMMVLPEIFQMILPMMVLPGFFHHPCPGGGRRFSAAPVPGMPAKALEQQIGRMTTWKKSWVSGIKEFW